MVEGEETLTVLAMGGLRAPAPLSREGMALGERWCLRGRRVDEGTTQTNTQQMLDLGQAPRDLFREQKLRRMHLVHLR